VAGLAAGGSPRSAGIYPRIFTGGKSGSPASAKKFFAETAGKAFDIGTIKPAEERQSSNHQTSNNRILTTDVQDKHGWKMHRREHRKRRGI